LGTEILNIFKNLNEKPEETPEGDLGGHDSEMFQKQHKALIKDSYLVKNLKRYAEDLFCKPFQFSKVQINNWYDYSCSILQPNVFNQSVNVLANDVKNFYTLLIYKKKKFIEWVSSNLDISTELQIFFNYVSPFKSFADLSLEYKLPLDLIKSVSKQISHLGFGRIVKKLTNNTILTINPDLVIRPNIEIEFLHMYGIDVYETLGLFMFDKGLSKIFKKHFNAFTSEKFLG
jgi:hypothetical protein